MHIIQMSQDRNPMDGPPLLDRIIIDKTHHFIMNLVILENLAEYLFTRSASPYNEHSRLMFRLIKRPPVFLETRLRCEVQTDSHPQPARQKKC